MRNKEFDLYAQVYESIICELGRVTKGVPSNETDGAPSGVTANTNTKTQNPDEVKPNESNIASADFAGIIPKDVVTVLAKKIEAITGKDNNEKKTNLDAVIMKFGNQDNSKYKNYVFNENEFTTIIIPAINKVLPFSTDKSASDKQKDEIKILFQTALNRKDKDIAIKPVEK